MQETSLFNNYPDIVKVEDLTEMLSISKNIAYDLVKQGKIYSKKIGNIYRIPKTAVISYITE